MSPAESVPAPAPVTVFVSDPSAEAERMAQALRAEGYGVVDVPLSMLVARVAVQRPRVIVVDADAHGAVDAITRIRGIDDADAIDMVLLGKAGEGENPEIAALAREESGYFERPIDAAAIVAKIAEITGGARRELRRSTAPPSAPPSRAPSLPPPSMRAATIGARHTPPPPRGSIPLLAGAGMDLTMPSLRRPTGPQAPLSNELEMLLLEAEQRIGGQMVSTESMLPSPEEEIEAVLPAEVLASLDEPLDDDEEDLALEHAPGAHHRGTTTGPGKGSTGGNTGSSSTGNSTGPGRIGGPTPERASAPRTSPSEPPEVTIPPMKTHGGTNAGSTGASTTGSGGMSAPLLPSTTSAGAFEASPPPPIAVEIRQAPTLAPMTLQERPQAPQPRVAAIEPPAVAQKIVLATGDAPRVIADAVAARKTGVIAFESTPVVRRVALREGDVVFAASTADDESLLPFLAARGELPRDRVAQLAGRVPPFGRHAGAALVAHGYLRQDALWTVLRAHAEWVLARVVATTDGTAGFEDEPPARVKSEPSVFGASTGAEVLVEVIRRVVSPADAAARLGGDGARVAPGANGALQTECALGAAETDWVARAQGRTVGEATGSAADPDYVSVLYALALLHVCETIRPLNGPGPRASSADAGPVVEALDEEAVRARVRARLQLVEEGDYFAVLGVGRDATSYEVKRAFLELRRAFEPSKLLTSGLVDLKSDVQKIASILDEAYEILRDGARRERYRRAIDTVPR